LRRKVPVSYKQKLPVPKDVTGTCTFTFLAAGVGAAPLPPSSRATRPSSFRMIFFWSSVTFFSCLFSIFRALSANATMRYGTVLVCHLHAKTVIPKIVYRQDLVLCKATAEPVTYDETVSSIIQYERVSPGTGNTVW